MTKTKKAAARPARASKPKRPKKATIVEDSDFLEEPSIDEATSEPNDRRRARRARPTPTFLLEQQDQDAIAKRRVLMILRVLSGETPVTDAIEGTDITRQTYYQLEEKALRAMMRALTPGAETSVPTGPDPSMTRKIVELETRVKQLEQEKRRAERMLYLTRKVLPSGTMKSGQRGRSSKSDKRARGGSNGSTSSRVARNWTTTIEPPEDGTADSTPKHFEAEPHGGTAS